MQAVPKDKCRMCDAEMDVYFYTTSYPLCQKHYEEIKERLQIAKGDSEYKPLTAYELILELLIQGKDHTVRSIYGNEQRAIIAPDTPRIIYPRWYIWLGKLVVRVEKAGRHG